MRHLWLFWMPLLFLPNLGIGGAASFGTLELSDYLIGPFIILLGAATRWRRGPAVSRLTPLLFAFVGWALFSTLLIRERYGYSTDFQVIAGVLKLGKLVLYGTAGILAARALGDDSQRRLFAWSLLAAGVVVGVTLIQLQGVSDWFRAGQAIEGYKTKNAVSVMLAMLICYLGGLWVTAQGTYRWRTVAVPGLIVMVLGFLLSNGRGGWVSAMGGLGYLLIRRGIGTRSLVGLVGAGALLATAYGTLPEFRADLDRTLWPDREYLQRYSAGVAGIDDGARMVAWTHELAVLARAPLLGTGFFHRGGDSGLWSTGSHNFFLQMFLETGVIGGALILAVFARMWNQAGCPAARTSGQDAPLRAGLIAAIVGGMSGEYFYGGTVSLVLLLIYAPVGALAAPRRCDRGPRTSFRRK